MRVLVTGGTGRLGRVLVAVLGERGHDVVAASRRGPVRLDLATGEGLDAALEGASVVVHCASAPFRDEQNVDVLGTRRLVDAAGDRHLVYVSIVGIDRVPTAYYRAKVAAEAEVA